MALELLMKDIGIKLWWQGNVTIVPYPLSHIRKLSHIHTILFPTPPPPRKEKDNPIDLDLIKIKTLHPKLTIQKSWPNPRLNKLWFLKIFPKPKTNGSSIYLIQNIKLGPNSCSNNPRICKCQFEPKLCEYRLVINPLNMSFKKTKFIYPFDKGTISPKVFNYDKIWVLKIIRFCEFK